MKTNSPDYRIAELERKVTRLVRVGTIESVDHEAAKARVRIGDLITFPLKWECVRAGTERAWYAPSLGEQVIVVSPDGALAQGFILGGIYSQAHPAPETSGNVTAYHFGDGGKLRYNSAAHHLEVLLPDGATAHIVAPGGVTIDGDVTVNGSITATGDITDATRSMADDRDLYNQHTHGNTPPPMPEQ